MKTKNIILKCLVFCVVFISSFSFFTDTVYCVDNRLKNKEGIESFFDSFFTKNMEQSNIPGLTFTLVQNGEVVFEKGYGYYDLENKKQVDPKKTIFPIESTSKVITGIAAMQLVEKGKLDVDEDIASYINKFKINNPYNVPITLHNLLTHTSGFDDTDIEMYVRTKEQLPDLEEYLSKKLPDVIMEPGKVISYSNHGFALVGYLIQEATNMPFDEYIDKNIVNPLNMDRSGFFIDEDLNDDIALNYVYQNGKYQRGESYFHLYSPAGLFKSTASDMSKFMIALLNDGKYQSENILNADTIESVYNTQFTQHPNLEGWTYGFHEYFQNGKKIIMHSGDSILGFSSIMFLLPEENIGIFVAANTYAHDECANLLRDFIDTYYPTEKDVNTISINDAQKQVDKSLNKFTGNYVYNRYNRKTFLKIGNLFNQLKIREDDGCLAINNHLNGNFPPKWISVDRLIFKSQNDDSYVVFNENDKNKVDYIYTGKDLNFEKLSWYEYDTVNIVFIILVLIFFITTIILELKKIIKSKNDKNLFRLRFMSLITSILNLGFLVGITLYFMGGNITDIVFHVSIILKLLFALPIISVVITVLLFIFNLKCWCIENYHIKEKAYKVAFLIVSLVFILFLLNYNLLGFNY